MSRVLFAFDLGDGTFAVYFAVYREEDRLIIPKSIYDPPFQVSAYAELGGATKVGDMIRSIPFAQLGKVSRIRSNFKAVPGQDPEGHLERFAAAVLADIRAKKPEYFTDEYRREWYIGCPTTSQWRTSGVLHSYQQIFERAGMENVHLVYESNAALACFDNELSDHLITRVAQAKESGKEDEISAAFAWVLRYGVLLLDYGSSTLDSSHLRPGEQPKIFGIPLGAALIDKGLLQVMLSQPEKYGYQGCSSPELVQEVAKRCCTDENFRYLLLLNIRTLKEMHFNKRKALGDMREFIGGPEPTAQTIPLDQSFQNGIQFNLFLTDQMLEDVINTPLQELLPAEFAALSQDAREFIGGKSWREANRAFLQKLKDDYQEFAAAEGGLLVLTGGASLMDFVQEDVAVIFPLSRTNMDSDPSTTIARGLLHYAPAAIRAETFDQVFDEILEMSLRDEKGNLVLDKDGKEQSLLYDLCWRAFCLQWLGGEGDESLIHKIAAQERQVLADAITDWMQGSIDSYGIVAQAKREFNTWCQNDLKKEFFRYSGLACEQLKKDVADLFHQLFVKYHLEDVVLFKDRPFVSQFAERMWKIMKETTLPSLMTADFDPLEAPLSKLPNPRIIPVIRPSRAGSVNIEAIRELLDEIYQSTGKFFIQMLSGKLQDIFAADMLLPVYNELEELKQNAIYRIGMGLSVTEEEKE